MIFEAFELKAAYINGSFDLKKYEKLINAEASSPF